MLLKVFSNLDLDSIVFDPWRRGARKSKLSTGLCRVPRQEGPQYPAWGRMDPLPAPCSPAPAQSPCWG